MPVWLQRQSKMIHSEIGTKHHEGAPESAGCSECYGPRWIDGNGPCVSISNMQMQHKEGCPLSDPWWKREPMNRWIIIYACCLKAPPLRLLWRLWSLKLVCSDCRRRVVSDLSDHRRFCHFWCERPVMLYKAATAVVTSGLKQFIYAPISLRSPAQKAKFALIGQLIGETWGAVYVLKLTWFRSIWSQHPPFHWVYQIQKKTCFKEITNCSK